MQRHIIISFLNFATLKNKSIWNSKSFLSPDQRWFIPDVLAKMATPMIGHRSKDASDLQRRITEKMRKLMFTSGKIVLSTSSGTGLMEGAIRNANRKACHGFFLSVLSVIGGTSSLSLMALKQIFIVKQTDNPTMPATVDKYLSTGKYDVVTITHNETSVGIMNPIEGIAEVIRKIP